MLQKSEIASGLQLKDIMENQLQDKAYQVVTKYCQSAWLDHSHTASCANCYFPVAIKLSVCSNLLLRCARIVIPQSLQQQMLARLHCGYQSITKCQQRARQSIWWPGISSDIDAMISKCLICCKYKKQNADPLKPTPFPVYPMQ